MDFGGVESTNLLFLMTAIFFAVFTQSLAGFGLGLVAMPLLSAMLGVRMAAPLVALVALTSTTTLLIRYRQSFNLRAVWRLWMSSLLGIPLGVSALRYVDEKVVLTLLGVVITIYALYALFKPALPEIKRPGWAYGFGFLGGLLSGAYNTSGPPVIIYGNCRRWRTAEFKSNLQGYFLLNSMIVTSTHALSHNVTSLVLKNYLLVLPVIGLGLCAGLSLDKYLNPVLFRKIVLGLLALLGIRLLFLG